MIIRYYTTEIEMIRFNMSVNDDKVHINEFYRYKFNCRSNPWKHLWDCSDLYLAGYMHLYLHLKVKPPFIQYVIKLN